MVDLSAGLRAGLLADWKADGRADWMAELTALQMAALSVGAEGSPVGCALGSPDG